MYFVFSFILLNALFLEEFTPLAKFYTAAGSEGIDKFQLCRQGSVNCGILGSGMGGNNSE